MVRHAAGQYWGDIDPSIFGTLFERGLDPEKRGQLGAHYTDREKIVRIVRPVIVEPLTSEWEVAKSQITELIGKAEQLETEAKTRGGRQASAALGQATVARKEAQDVLDRYLKRLSDFRVLDPACGSGNFLYVALRELKDLEHRAQVESEALGLARKFPSIGPEVVKGIEINSYAAELARVSVWIGEIQWMIRNGFPASQNPVLKPLDTIECRDALLTLTEAGEWTRSEWPASDVIIGNPPFLGKGRQRQSLDRNDLDRIRAVYRGEVKASANLVAYWFHKALRRCEAGTAAIGFVATQAIRRGASRDVVQGMLDAGLEIFDAWSNEPWDQGADVRVSYISLRKASVDGARFLNGEPVAKVSADLNADVATRRPTALVANRNVAAQGTISGGPFEIPPATARQMLRAPRNPNGRPNKDVLRPWRNGDDLTGRPADWWIIDFGASMTVEEAALYEKPFQHLKSAWEATQKARSEAGEKPLRNGEPKTSARWWKMQRRRDDLMQDLSRMQRYLVTPRVSKHRFFVWLHGATVPDTRLVVFRREDDAFAGILQSKHHRVWSLRFGGNHGVGNDPEYVHTSTFDTFPFPEGMTPDLLPPQNSVDAAAAIGSAFALLNELRESWLNPDDLVQHEPEVVIGFPARTLPNDAAAAEKLRERTLTALYNEPPEWLKNAHASLDAAVAAAYGWSAALSEADILRELFALNEARTAASSGATKVMGLKTISGPGIAPRESRRLKAKATRKRVRSGLQLMPT